MKIKRKSLFIIAFVLILALCVPAIGTFADGDNLAKNGDFEKLDSNGLPKNWEFTAYYDDGKASNYSVDQDAERGNVVKITNNTENVIVSYVVAPANPVPGSYCYKFLIEPATHQLYFYKKHKISKKTGAGFLQEDIKRIVLSRK